MRMGKLGEYGTAFELAQLTRRYSLNVNLVTYNRSLSSYQVAKVYENVASSDIHWLLFTGPESSGHFAPLKKIQEKEHLKPYSDRRIFKQYWYSPSNIGVDQTKFEYIKSAEQFLNSVTRNTTQNVIGESKSLYSVAIIGRSGVGKTTFTKQLVKKLSENYVNNNIVFGLVVSRKKVIHDLVAKKQFRSSDHLQLISCLEYTAIDSILLVMDEIETLVTKNNIKSTREQYLIICRVNQSYIILYDHVGFEGINSLREFNSKTAGIGRSLLSIQYSLGIGTSSDQFIKIWLGLYKSSVLRTIILCANHVSDKASVSGLLDAYIKFHRNHRQNTSVKKHGQKNKVAGRSISISHFDGGSAILEASPEEPRDNNEGQNTFDNINIVTHDLTILKRNEKVTEKSLSDSHFDGGSAILEDSPEKPRDYNEGQNTYTIVDFFPSRSILSSTRISANQFSDSAEVMEQVCLGSSKKNIGVNKSKLSQQNQTESGETREESCNESSEEGETMERSSHDLSPKMRFISKFSTHEQRRLSETYYLQETSGSDDESDSSDSSSTSINTEGVSDKSNSGSSDLDDSEMEQLMETYGKMAELSLSVLNDRLTNATTPISGLNKKYSNIYCLHQTPPSTNNHISLSMIEGKRMYVSKKCGHKTASRRTTKEHIEVNHYKSYFVCPICMKSYRSSANMALQRHIKLCISVIKQLIEEKIALLKKKKKLQ
ncbi:uncharacterized protein LOC103570454 isoform X2 [Microplitis demolitor]|uniref:uncharacterized protein LOC103570454 isoform X2 n=1 Tax=Microplitis demolitor TaxID=69319 RepID=UPI0006D5002E|nr:uncharacterized protein LOC103570454 isoform X2 [Microplitis demolitor]